MCLPYPNSRKSHPAIMPTAQLRDWPLRPRNFFMVGAWYQFTRCNARVQSLHGETRVTRCSRQD